jgi:hypothetical protein
MNTCIPEWTNTEMVGAGKGTPLDPARHREMRVGALPDYPHASEQQHAILGFSEILLAAADYPLLLMKHEETGRFNVVALYDFGCTARKNLYVLASHWHATYIPQSTLRYPFMASDAGVLGLAVDERSGLVGETEGHRLFDESGRPTEYTVKIAKALQWMKKDFEAMQAFAQVLAQKSLLKPLSLLLRLEDASEQQLEGLYTLDEQALASAAESDIITLHRNGFLRAASILAASLVQLNRLQQLHTAQLKPRIVDIAMGARPVTPDAP